MIVMDVLWEEEKFNKKREKRKRLDWGIKRMGGSEFQCDNDIQNHI